MTNKGEENDFLKLVHCTIEKQLLKGMSLRTCDKVCTTSGEKDHVL